MFTQPTTIYIVYKRREKWGKIVDWLIFWQHRRVIFQWFTCRTNGPKGWRLKHIVVDAHFSFEYFVSYIYFSGKERERETEGLYLKKHKRWSGLVTCKKKWWRGKRGRQARAKAPLKSEEEEWKKPIKHWGNIMKITARIYRPTISWWRVVVEATHTKRKCFFLKRKKKGKKQKTQESGRFSSLFCFVFHHFSQLVSRLFLAFSHYFPSSFVF